MKKLLLSIPVLLTAGILISSCSKKPSAPTSAKIPAPDSVGKVLPLFNSDLNQVISLDTAAYTLDMNDTVGSVTLTFTQRGVLTGDEYSSPIIRNHQYAQLTLPYLVIIDSAGNQMTKYFMVAREAQTDSLGKVLQTKADGAKHRLTFVGSSQLTDSLRVALSKAKNFMVMANVSYKPDAAKIDAVFAKMDGYMQKMQSLANEIDNSGCSMYARRVIWDRIQGVAAQAEVYYNKLMELHEKGLLTEEQSEKLMNYKD